MYAGKIVALLIPARDEEAALPAVLGSVPSWVDRVVVVDNGSSDGTALVAGRCGAEVVREPVAGYGRACLTGLAALRSAVPQIVAFADADGSDDLVRLHEVVGPVAECEVELVLARRQPAGAGAMTGPQRFGNRLATGLIRLVWRHSYQDLGPMRAITWPALQALEMEDRGFGWTVQMQIRAITHGLRVREVGLLYKSRLAGRSKISGTVGGTIRAGAKILAVIAKEAVKERPRMQSWRGVPSSPEP